MLAVALYSGRIVLSEVDAIQQQVGALPSTLAPNDARRIRFDALHQLSTRLMMVNVAAALMLLYWEAREPGDSGPQLGPGRWRVRAQGPFSGVV